jgi:hypothetical protein
MKVHEDKKAVLVIGMHRSGTSLLTAGLEQLGLSLGRECLVANALDNPKGYFESKQILAFNEALLKRLDSRWDDSLFDYRKSVLSLNQHEIAELKQDACHLLENEFSEIEHFAIKDPRMCILLPFWIEVLCSYLGGKENLHLIIIVRNPIEVAKSQYKRHQKGLFQADTIGKNLDETISLWFTSYTTALRNIGDLKNICVSHENLLANGGALLREIATFLEIENKEYEIERFTSEFVQTSLHREKSNDDELSELKKRQPYIAQLYDFLTSKSNCGTITSQEAQKILNVLNGLEEVLSVYQPLSPLFSEMTHIIEEQRVQIYEQSKQLRELETIKCYPFLGCAKVLYKLKRSLTKVLQKASIF